MSDIADMTNRELNIAIAVEVMGWDKEKVDVVIHDISDLNNIKSYSGLTRAEAVTFDDTDSSFVPTRNIAQAWKVVERMRNTGWLWFAEWDHRDPWCMFRQDDFGTDGWIACRAKTLPRAICEAALAAVRSNHD